MILPCFLGLGSEKEIQVGLGVQKLNSRKRLRPNDDEQSETSSSADSMETDEHPKHFLSELDSEESDMDVGSELLDSMGGIEKEFDHTLKMLRKYFDEVEKYDKIEEEEKRAIIQKYVKLKGIVGC